ncbi:MAG: protein translocase subunit SecD [Armatimonadetes bacterium]|nr:protein translocase subunit SecD [Armatimonadota bacterium]
MKSRNNIFLTIVIVLTGLSIWGFKETPFSYGLDVKGGIRLIYKVEQTEDSKEAGRTIEQDVKSAIRVLERRAASGLGVVESSVRRKGVNQITVELPGFTDVDEARKLLGSTGRLYGYWAKNVSTRTQRRRYERSDTITVEGAPVEMFMRSSGGDPFGPEDPEYEKMIEGWEVIIQGQDLKSAAPLVRGNGGTVPEFRFSSAGAKKMEAWTRKYRNRGENLAFVIDSVVYSIAPIRENTILTDQAFIDGDFDPKAVKALCQLLNDGALDVLLSPLAEEKVDPSIGLKALDKIVVAGGISFAGICLFLIIYYSAPGFIAMIAMILYALFTITALKMLHATFSLASIAALILSVGMAVDANVLVFERIKEELRGGRELMSAVELGFKRALTAIVDSNACTILTCIVLFIFGTGPVIGFATTLMVGVAISFFTAFTVTRSLLIGSLKIGLFNDPKFFAFKRNWFGERLEEGADKKPLEILGRRKTWFILSGVLIGIGALFVIMGGIKPNVEFAGGGEGIFRNVDNLSKSEIESRLATAGYKNFNVKRGSGIDPDTGEEFELVYVTIPAGGAPASAGTGSAATPDDSSDEPGDDSGADTASDTSDGEAAVDDSETETTEETSSPQPADDDSGTGIAEETAGPQPADDDSGSEATSDSSDGEATDDDSETETTEETSSPQLIDDDSETETTEETSSLQLIDEDSDGETSDDDTSVIAASAEIASDNAMSDALAAAIGLPTEGASFRKVGPTIQKETVTNAILAVIVASALIVLYLAIRFGFALGGLKNGLKFGLSAVAALAHDIMFVLGFAGIVGYLVGWEISSLFITAMLTVIGFSVHDSIVIFDRIRENLRRPHKGQSFEHLINKSITQSVARSINTSVTAFVPLMVLVIWGTSTPELKFMCLTMAAGIAVGTYSSIFNASPILWLWNRATMKRQGEKAGLMLEAEREAKLRAKQVLEADSRSYKTESGQTYGQIKRRRGTEGEQKLDDDDK